MREDPQKRIVPDGDEWGRMSFPTAFRSHQGVALARDVQLRMEGKDFHNGPKENAVSCTLLGDCGLESQPGAFGSHWSAAPARDLQSCMVHSADHKHQNKKGKRVLVKVTKTPCKTGSLIGGELGS